MWTKEMHEEAKGLAEAFAHTDEAKLMIAALTEIDRLQEQCRKLQGNAPGGTTAESWMHECDNMQVERDIALAEIDRLQKIAPMIALDDITTEMERLKSENQRYKDANTVLLACIETHTKELLCRISDITSRAKS